MWGFKNELESKMFLAFKIIFGFLLPLSVIGFSYVNILKAIRNKKLDSAGFKRNYYSKIFNCLLIVFWHKKKLVLADFQYFEVAYFIHFSEN